MAGVEFQKIHLKSVLLVLLFVVSLWAPVVPVHSDRASLEESNTVLLTAPHTLESGYGHDIASSTVNVDGLVQAGVREESMFDMWITTPSTECAWGTACEETRENARSMRSPQ